MAFVLSTCYASHMAIAIIVIVMLHTVMIDSLAVTAL